MQGTTPIPFVGPRPFQVSDQSFFFGRETEIDSLCDRVLAFQCTLLYSRSGFGKSSLVEAGLRPRLASQGWVVLPTARVARRTRAREDTTGNPFVQDTLDCWEPGRDSSAPDTIPEFIAAARGADSGIVAVFDQFEEFYTGAGTTAQREEFFEQLRAACMQRSALRALIVIREEFLADLDSHARRLPNNLANRMRLERLDRPAVADALRRPFGQIGVSIDDEAMAALLDSLTREQVRTSSGELTDVPGNFAEPVHLQIVARQLWTALPSGTSVITLEEIQGLESQDALATYYQSCVDQAALETGVRASRIVKWCSEVMVTPDGTRALVYRGADETSGMPNSVIASLQQRHLVRAELRAAAVWLELAHDQFVRPVLAAKTAWERKMAGPLARVKAWENAAKEAVAAGAATAKPLGPNEVAEAERWLASDASADIVISQDLLDYIEFSRQRNDSEQREMRKLHAQRLLLALGLAAAIGLAWWGFAQKNRGDALSNDLARVQQLQIRLVQAEARRANAEREKTQAANQELQRTTQALSNSNTKLAALSNSLKGSNAQLQRKTDALDSTQRFYTASQLKDRVRERGFGVDPDQLLKLAYLAANVTYVRDGTISADAESAMHLALPAVRQGRPRERAPLTFTAQGTRFVTLAGNEARIFSLPDVRLVQSIDLTPWSDAKSSPSVLGDDNREFVTLNDAATRVQITKGSRVIVLDISEQQRTVFDRTFDASQRGSFHFDRAGKQLAVADKSQHTVWSVDENRPIGSVTTSARLVGFDHSGEHLVFSLNDRAIGVSQRPFDSMRVVWESAIGFRQPTVVNDKIVMLLATDELVTIGIDGRTAGVALKLAPPVIDIGPHPSEPAVLVVWAPSVTPGSASSRGPSIYTVELIRIPEGTRARPTTMSLAERPVVMRDGRIVTRDSSDVIHLWAADGQHERTLEIGTPPQFGLTFSNAGYLAAAPGDGSSAVWRSDASVPEAKEKWRWRPIPLRFPGAGVVTIVLASNSTRALVAYGTGEMRLGDILADVPERVFTHGPDLSRIAVNSDWSMMASADTHGGIKIWKLGASEPPKVLAAAHKVPVTAIAFHDDASRLVSASSDGEIKVWSTASGDALKTLRVTGAVTALAFRGNDLISGDSNGAIRIWDHATGELKGLLEQESRVAVGDIAVHPDRTRIAVGSGDETIRIYDLRVGEEVLKIEGYNSPVKRVTFDTTGKNVIGIDEWGTIRIDPILPKDLMAAVRERIQRQFTRNECLAFAKLVPDACPPK